MNLAATFNHFLHLSCVIFWIGGIAFQRLIVAPFLKSDRPPPDYLTVISDRFQKLISPILFILIVTGGINIGFRRAGHDAFPPGYISMLGFKVLLVAGVASIHFFGIIRSQQNNPPRQSDGWNVLPRQSYVRWTFALGTIIIFIATLLRQWAF